MEAGESLHSQDTRLAENQVSPCGPPRPTGEAPLVDLVFSPLKRQIDLDGDIEVLQIIQQFPNQLDFCNHGYLGTFKQNLNRQLGSEAAGTGFTAVESAMLPEFIAAHAAPA